jgi:hypothetical protein
MTWQPIETAPKDGTPILAYCNHEADTVYILGTKKLTDYASACEAYRHVPNGIYVVGRFPEQECGDWEGGYIVYPGYWALEGSDGEICANPTHWMPLPKELT